MTLVTVQSATFVNMILFICALVINLFDNNPVHNAAFYALCACMLLSASVVLAWWLRPHTWLLCRKPHQSTHKRPPIVSEKQRRDRAELVRKATVDSIEQTQNLMSRMTAVPMMMQVNRCCSCSCCWGAIFIFIFS